jgi:hypothetical protein
MTERLRAPKAVRWAGVIVAAEMVVAGAGAEGCATAVRHLARERTQ